MDRPAMARARLNEVKAELREISEAGPPCIACQHHEWTGHCSNVALQTRSYSHSTGKLVEAVEVETDAARAPDGLCGPEGLLWEPLPWYRAPFAEAFSIANRHPWLALSSFFGLWGLFDLLF